MIQYIKHSSDAIKDFPMGDPHDRELPVWLPPNYDGKRRSAYPVIFVLAGWGSKGSKYLNDGSVFGWSFVKNMGQAMESKQIPECIFVFPDGSSKLGCSQYINSPSIGNYMDYICDELTALVDEKFNTKASADYRAVMGHSSGGFGSLHIGMNRPDRFGHILSSAGDSFFQVSVMPVVTHCIVEIEKAGSIKNFVEKYLSDPNPQGYSRFMTMLTLSYAAAYAPNPNSNEIHGELFFDLETGEIFPEVWEKYLSFDPVVAVKKKSSKLKKLKSLFLECGAQDEYAAQLGHRQIANTLSDAGVSYELEEYPGKHSGLNFRMENRSLKLLKAMGF